MLHMASHHLPAPDKILKAGNDSPDSGQALTQECLLHVRWPDVLKVFPVFPAHVEVHVATMVGEGRHGTTCIHKKDKLGNCLLRN